MNDADGVTGELRTGLGQLQCRASATLLGLDIPELEGQRGERNMPAEQLVVEHAG